MGAKVRPYLFCGSAVSICTSCLRRVEAKILIKDEHLYLEKWCPHHERERVLISDDAAYYRQYCELYSKPPELPRRFNTPQHYGSVQLRPLSRAHAALLPYPDRDHRSPAICVARSATPKAARTAPAFAIWRRWNACSTRQWPTKASLMWCRFPAASQWSRRACTT